jgi:phage-related protein
MLVTSTFPILKGAVEFIVNNVLPPLTQLFEYIADELIPKVGSIFEEMAPRIQGTMETIWAIVEPILNDVMSLFNLVFPTILDTVTNVFNTIGDVVNGAIQIFQGLIDFIVGVFTGDWEMAWNGIVEIFSGIFEGLRGIVRGAMNGVINMVNLAIRSLNSMSFKMPDIMGGGTVGLNVGTIPMLKDGGNIVKGGLTLVGEDGPEFLNLPKGASVTPLNSGKKIDIYITGNTIMNDRDVDRIGTVLVNRLNRLGISSV